MSKKEMQLFDGLISEYELRAKYNDDQRDYEIYSMLVNARGILAEHLKEQNNGNNDFGN